MGLLLNYVLKKMNSKLKSFYQFFIVYKINQDCCIFLRISRSVSSVKLRLLK
jgi:hypothetical protein